MDFDENCIYPYLGKHIPKYEPTIQFLTGEHKELRDNFVTFEHLLADLKVQRNDAQHQGTINKLRDRWVYLFCVIRNHLQAEEQIIHKAILEQLHTGEKKELFEIILQCECAKNYIHKHSEESQ